MTEKSSEGILKASKVGDLKMVTKPETPPPRPALNRSLFQIKELHSQGFSLSTMDSTGQTALHYAAKHGHKDIVKYLIACIPPSLVNATDSNLGQTALHKAAYNKWRSVCCILVAAGAPLTIADNKGMTPRMLALQVEDHELANYLESKSVINSSFANIFPKN